MDKRDFSPFCPWLSQARLNPDVVGSRYSNDNRVNRIRGPADRLNRPFLSDRYSSPSEGVAMDWKTMLAYISGSVDEELLLRNEYLVAENRILRNQIKGRSQ